MKEGKLNFLPTTFNKVSIKHLQGGMGMHFRPFEVTIITSFCIKKRGNFTLINFDICAVSLAFEFLFS